MIILTASHELIVDHNVFRSFVYDWRNELDPITDMETGNLYYLIFGCYTNGHRLQLSDKLKSEDDAKNKIEHLALCIRDNDPMFSFAKTNII
jgi:hypothetical protein